MSKVCELSHIFIVLHHHSAILFRGPLRPLWNSSQELIRLVGANWHDQDLNPPCHNLKPSAQNDPAISWIRPFLSKLECSASCSAFGGVNGGMAYQSHMMSPGDSASLSSSRSRTSQGSRQPEEFDMELTYVTENVLGK